MPAKHTGKKVSKKIPAEVSAAARLMSSKVKRESRVKAGQAGGPARAASLTAAKRQKIARKAAKARWKKVAAEKRASKAAAKQVEPGAD